MKIVVSKDLPSAKRLITLLKQEFSPKYAFRLYGIGEERSIIVRKSFFVGAQITKANGNEVVIEGIPPSAAASLLSILLQQLANLFLLFSPSRYKELEQELGLFMRRKFN